MTSMAVMGRELLSEEIPQIPYYRELKCPRRLSFSTSNVVGLAQRTDVVLK